MALRPNHAEADRTWRDARPLSSTTMAWGQVADGDRCIRRIILCVKKRNNAGAAGGLRTFVWGNGAERAGGREHSMGSGNEATGQPPRAIDPPGCRVYEYLPKVR